MSQQEAERRRLQSALDNTPEARARILAAYISEPDAAAELGVDKRTLRKWRRAGTGPPGWLKIGTRFYYRIAAIEQWLAAKEAKPLRQRPSTRGPSARLIT